MTPNPQITAWDGIAEAIENAVALWRFAGCNDPLCVELPGGTLRFLTLGIKSPWLLPEAGSYLKFGGQDVDFVHRLVLQHIPEFRLAAQMLTGTHWRIAYDLMPPEWRRRYQRHELDGRVRVIRDAVETTGAGIAFALFDGHEFQLDFSAVSAAFDRGWIVRTA